MESYSANESKQELDEFNLLDLPAEILFMIFYYIQRNNQLPVKFHQNKIFNELKTNPLLASFLPEELRDSFCHYACGPDLFSNSQLSIDLYCMLSNLCRTAAVSKRPRKLVQAFIRDLKVSEFSCEEVITLIYLLHSLSVSDSYAKHFNVDKKNIELSELKHLENELQNANATINELYPLIYAILFKQHVQVCQQIIIKYNSQIDEILAVNAKDNMFDKLEFNEMCLRLLMHCQNSIHGSVYAEITNEQFPSELTSKLLKIGRSIVDKIFKLECFNEKEILQLIDDEFANNVDPELAKEFSQVNPTLRLTDYFKSSMQKQSHLLSLVSHAHQKITESPDSCDFICFLREVITQAKMEIKQQIEIHRYDPFVSALTFRTHLDNLENSASTTNNNSDVNRQVESLLHYVAESDDYLHSISLLKVAMNHKLFFSEQTQSAWSSLNFFNLKDAKLHIDSDIIRLIDKTDLSNKMKIKMAIDLLEQKTTYEYNIHYGD